MYVRIDLVVEKFDIHDKDTKSNKNVKVGWEKRLKKQIKTFSSQRND